MLQTKLNSAEQSTLTHVPQFPGEKGSKLGRPPCGQGFTDSSLHLLWRERGAAERMGTEVTKTKLSELWVSISFP